jgi:hypothetical protein
VFVLSLLIILVYINLILIIQMEFLEDHDPLMLQASFEPIHEEENKS